MEVLYRRLKYFLSPQLHIYKGVAKYTKGKSVLEAGFGTGAGVIQYAHNAKSVTAIEIDRDCVEFAKDAFPQNNVSWEYGDICNETLALYDVIVMIEVIEHIKDWEHALQVCRDRLLHDGTLIISTPNKNGTFIKNPLHGDEWTAQEFKARLKRYFRTVRLYDFSLENEQDVNTNQTPLVAVCTKGEPVVTTTDTSNNWQVIYGNEWEKTSYNTGETE